ncbi:MAG: DUF309 domain-containing protein [Ignavibacteriae bacterium]|nr:DUF309 domain-containing protein [Ignavibacteriota bacterium]
MKSVRPQKKKPREIDRSKIEELSMTLDDWAEFEHGVELFNSGKFWHSHEAWELVWRRHAEDERLFLQGLIQLAAAYHQLMTKHNYRGLINNFNKAYEKLEVFQPEYSGVLITPLLKFIEQGKKEAERLGPKKIAAFNYNLIPKLQFHKPYNPDLVVALRELLKSEEFLEGVKLFNTGYHWEAHEVWEDVWREQQADARTFVQAFVQTAAAYSFLKIRKISSAKYLFQKALEKFQQFENTDCPLPLKAIMEDIHHTLELLAIHPSQGEATLKYTKPLTIELTPA